ncbi:MAG: hypothetical protein H6739_05820 [Alphaproteobacteria bacterium]|nr:hypothetical protein [Alphaproteobacteria bacterium]
MASEYLDWLADIFEEAQVRYDDSTAEYLDRAMHAIAGVDYPQTEDDAVFRVLKERYLRLGPPGRQLLAAYIRDRVYADRSSPFRPKEGTGHFTNEGYGR